MEKNDKIQLLHPAGKNAPRISMETYMLISDAIVQVLQEHQPISFADMAREVRHYVQTNNPEFTGSVEWFTVSVKQHMEAEGIVWAITGPVFGFSDTWQLVINTGTTIITFLMVFVIQQSQNKETVALHLKLNELIAATKGASNRLIDIEDLTEQEIETIKAFYVRLSKLAAKERDLLATHTIEEAHNVHKAKKG